jgi:hypothetical protein
VNRLLGDASERVSELGLRINIVHLGRDDRAVHDRGSFAATVGTAEHFSPQGDTTHAALCGVVGQAVRPSSRKRVNALQRISM